MSTKNFKKNLIIIIIMHIIWAEQKKNYFKSINREGNFPLLLQSHSHDHHSLHEEPVKIRKLLSCLLTHN